MVLRSGNGKFEQFRGSLLAGDPQGPPDGKALAGLDGNPCLFPGIPVCGLMSVEGLVVQADAAYPQKLYGARIAIDFKFVAVGFQGAAIVELNLVSFQYPAVFFGH